MSGGLGGPGLEDGDSCLSRLRQRRRAGRNRTLFARILLGPDADDIRVELNEPYPTLLARDPDEENATESSRGAGFLGPPLTPPYVRASHTAVR